MLPRALGEDELIDALRGVSLLGIRSGTHVTGRVLDAAPELVAPPRDRNRGQRPHHAVFPPRRTGSPRPAGKVSGQGASGSSDVHLLVGSPTPDVAEPWIAGLGGVSPD
jgi:hypothetical protein